MLPFKSENPTISRELPLHPAKFKLGHYHKT
jgi:hypothetical protein